MGGGGGGGGITETCLSPFSGGCLSRPLPKKLEADALTSLQQAMFQRAIGCLMVDDCSECVRYFQSLYDVTDPVVGRNKLGVLPGKPRLGRVLFACCFCVLSSAVLLHPYSALPSCGG